LRSMCKVGSNACAMCISNTNIGGAVTAWVSGPSSATAAYGDIGDWNTAAVTSMASLFGSTPTFNADVSKWNVAAVSNMASMFSGAGAFDQDISKWNVLRVANLVAAFDNATALSPVKKRTMCLLWGATLRAAFSGAYSFCLADASLRSAVSMWVTSPAKATANYGPIGEWDVSAVANLDSLFAEKSSFNSDIGLWNTASVTTMVGTFSGASAFNCDIGKWNTGSVTAMGFIFNGASSFAQSVVAWNVTSVTSLKGRAPPSSHRGPPCSVETSVFHDCASLQCSNGRRIRRYRLGRMRQACRL
jgi:surface protein